MLSFFLELAGSLVAPDRCAACDARVRMRTVFCPPCASTTLEASHEKGCTAAFLYGGAIARAIARFKYEGRSDLARPLSALLLRPAPRLAALSPEIVIPVPMHPLRLAERGYNHAALLARPLARYLRIPFSPLALRRTRDTAQQASLARPARLANVENAFSVRQPGAVRGLCVLLVDDVRTTGATLGACRQALLAEGAGDVHAVVLALAPT